MIFPIPTKLANLLNAEIISHAGYALLLRTLGIGMAFVAHALIAKALGASEYGSYSLVITAVSLLSAASMQGYDLSAQKFIPSYRVQNQSTSIRGFLLFSIKRVFCAGLIASIAMAMVGMLISGRKSDLGFLLQIALLLLIATTMMQYYSAILRAYKKVLSALIPIDLLRTFLLVITGGCMLTWSHIASSLNAMILTIAGAMISLAVAVFLYHRCTRVERLSTGNFEEKKDWSHVSRPLYLATLLGLMQTQIDILLVGFFCTTEQVGIYSLSSRIAALVWLGGYAVSSVSGAIMSEMLSKPEGSTKLQGLFQTIALGQIIYTLPVAAILLYLGTDLLSYFGSDYANGYLALSILSIAFSLASLSGPVGVLMSVTGYQHQSMVVTAIAVCLQVLLSLLLIPAYGIVGAASATAACFVGRILAMLVIVQMKLGIDCSALCLLKRHES